MKQARSLAPFVLAAVAGLGLADCSEPTGPADLTLGALIARESLTVADGDQVPCCTVISSGTQVTILGGALSFYAAAHYSDTIATPGGLKSRACVQELANGALLTQTGLVILPDGSTYLLLPCSVGGYRLSLTRQVISPDGSIQTNDVLVTWGSFSWQRDKLTLMDSEGDRVTASLSGDRVAVTVPGHLYQFAATAIR
jgi:hypothetical protein